MCCKGSRENKIDIKPPLLLSLGNHSKQIGDERNLPCDVPFVDTSHLSFPHSVHDLISAARVRHTLSIAKKLSPGLMRRLMKR